MFNNELQRSEKMEIISELAHRLRMRFVTRRKLRGIPALLTGKAQPRNANI